MEILLVEVTVTTPDGEVFRKFVIDHNDDTQRRALGARCHDAFAAGWSISTKPVSSAALAKAGAA